MAERGVHDMLAEVLIEMVKKADPKTVGAALVILSTGVAIGAGKLGGGLDRGVSFLKSIRSTRAADATIDQP